MGDLADSHSCNALIIAFAQDIIRRYRSKILDQAFGDKVRYYVMADDNWVVRLYAAIRVSYHGAEEEHFRVEGSPEFYGPSDSIIDDVRDAFLELSKEEIERRLEVGAEEDIEDTEARRRLQPSIDMWTVGTMKRFNTTYDTVAEYERNGQRCRIVAIVPDDDTPGVDNYLVEFDDGHQYEAYISEIQEAWVGVPMVECKLCHKQVPAETAHLHQGSYIGDACGCWDERLRATE